MASTKSLEERKLDFLERLKELYPDYKLVSDYKNADNFVFLQHKSGVIWKTKPRYLDGKRQCKEVNLSERKLLGKNNTPLTNEEFLEKFYSKYSKDEYKVISVYKNYKTKMRFLHKTCGKEFEITPKDILYSRSKGCPFCYTKKKRTVESVNNDFQSREDLKDYECISVFSKGGHVYGEIIHHCEKCNNSKFVIRISDMLSIHEQRCPSCKTFGMESKAVQRIKKYLDENNIEYIQEKRYETCRDKAVLPFDFYLPKFDLLIEYDGVQHFRVKSNSIFTEEKLEIIKKHDKMKNQWCKENNKKLLRIKYTKNEIIVLENFLKENYNF